MWARYPSCLYTYPIRGTTYPSSLHIPLSKVTSSSSPGVSIPKKQNNNVPKNGTRVPNNRTFVFRKMGIAFPKTEQFCSEKWELYSQKQNIFVLKMGISLEKREKHRSLMIFI